jgi:hypothetical protein
VAAGRVVDISLNAIQPVDQRSVADPSVLEYEFHPKPPAVAQAQQSLLGIEVIHSRSRGSQKSTHSRIARPGWLIAAEYQRGVEQCACSTFFPRRLGSFQVNFETALERRDDPAISSKADPLDIGALLIFAAVASASRRLDGRAHSVILPALVRTHAVNIFRLLQKENPSVPLPIRSFREAHAERWRMIRMRTLAERAQSVGTPHENSI